MGFRPRSHLIGPRPVFRQDFGGWMRQNAAMRVPRLLCLPASGLLVLFGTSCASSPVNEGDAAFRRGEYRQALAIYEEEGDVDDDSEIGRRIRRTRHFVLEGSARRLLGEDRPTDAQEVLAVMESQGIPEDRLDEVEALYFRSLNRLAVAAEEGAQRALEDGDPETAVVLAQRALSLDPNVRLAAATLQHAENQIRYDREGAEDAYLAGMEQLRLGYEARARTAFIAALRMEPEDSRTALRLEAVTLDLAAEARTMARLYWEANRLGQAWVTYRDAVHLDPENEEGRERLAELEREFVALSLLDEADLAARGGRTELVVQILGELEELGIDMDETPRAREVAIRARETRNHQDYVRARAYELDSQTIHALGRYRAILDREQDNGWEDVELRSAALERRVGEAAQVFVEALAAQRDGNMVAYREGIEKVVRLAADYGDAMDRYAALIAAEAEPN